MKKTLYYVVENEVETGDDECFATGNKSITVYEIIGNIPNKIAFIVCGIDEGSCEAIQNYFEDINSEDEDFDFYEKFSLYQL